MVHSFFDGEGWGLTVSPEVEVTTLQETCQRMADGFAENIRQHPADWHMLQPQWNEDVDRRRQQRQMQRRRPPKQKR